MLITPTLDLSVNQLLSIHNARAVSPLNSWKSGKAKLLDRISLLPEPRVETKGALEEAYEEAIAEVAIGAADPIHVASEKLLCKTALRHDGKDWGIPYARVLTEMKRVFPDCKTTVACLRWYAVHMNESGVKLPHRKRSKGNV